MSHVDSPDVLDHLFHLSDKRKHTCRSYLSNVTAKPRPLVVTLPRISNALHGPQTNTQNKIRHVFIFSTIKRDDSALRPAVLRTALMRCPGPAQKRCRDHHGCHEVRQSSTLAH